MTKDDYRAAIVSVRPDLAGLPLTVHTGGWDSDAVEVGAIIFKFPKRPDAIPRERRYRLLPLHFIGDGSPLDHALLDARNEPALDAPIGVHPMHPDGLVLVPEATWEWALSRLPPRDRAYFAGWPTI